MGDDGQQEGTGRDIGEGAYFGPYLEADAGDVDLYIERMCKAPLLKADEEKRLAVRVSQGDRAAKAELVEHNIRLVVSIAKKYRHLSNPAMSFTDMLQEGTIGLIRAIERFDHTKGFRLTTYAFHWIKQSITRGIADKGLSIRRPVHVADNFRVMARTFTEMEIEMGAEPSIKEVADRLGWPVNQALHLWRMPKDPISLDEPTQAMVQHNDSIYGGNSGSSVPDDSVIPMDELIDPWSDRPEEWADMWDTVEARLGDLTPRERVVINLMVGGVDDQETLERLIRCIMPSKGEGVIAQVFPLTGESWNMAKIARVLSVSRERVRQIERSALCKLRRNDVVKYQKDYVKPPKPGVVAQYLM